MIRARNLFRLAARRGFLRVAAAAVLLPMLGGCFATTKHVEMVQADLTKRSAWTDEQVASLQREITQVRAENDALRLRMDDMSDQLASLGGEVSTRISELEETDRQVTSRVQQATERTAAVGTDQEKNREELMARMNVILDEVVKENKRLLDRITALESNAYTFGRTHEVKAGESLAGIAAKYGLTADAIAQANGISDANLIQVGQQLLIPGVSP